MICTNTGCNDQTEEGQHRCPTCIVFDYKGKRPSAEEQQKAADAYASIQELSNDIVTVNLGRRAEDKAEFTGSNVDYYRVHIADPKRPEVEAYTAECEDIIEALNMTFAEGSAFKAIWRSAAARTLGLKKKGQDEHGIYDAEKVSYYGQAMLRMRKRLAAKKKDDPFLHGTGTK